MATKRLAEKHLPGVDFDDAVLFARMREAYYGELLGAKSVARFWRRWCSARVLVGIAVNPSPDTSAFEIGSSAIAPNPALAYRVDANSVRSVDIRLTEASIFTNFRKPVRARSQYSWVQWSNQAATLTSPTAGITLAQRPSLQRHQGPGPQFEFVEGWSVWRLLTAGTIVVMASVAVLLLWVFLGGGSGNLGVNGARDRLLPGIGLGLLTTLLGGLGMAMWIALSWIVM